VRRRDGGTHDPSNLTLRCSSCHTAHHDGRIAISGTAPDRLVSTRRHDHPAPVGVPVSAHVGAERRSAVACAAEGAEPGNSAPASAQVAASRLHAAITRTQARDALVDLGWKSSIAKAAVEEACAPVGVGAAIVNVIREALRRCPKPTR
jgi:hypothetical protein